MAVSALFSAKAALTADWRIHTPFDQWPVAVYDTPTRVYFVNRTFEYNPDVAGRDFNSYALHYYDKPGDEILSVNPRDGYSGNAVTCLAYNTEKNYLLVIYTDFSIDFLYNDGRIVNLQSLKNATIPGRKKVNGISFDTDNNLAYIATNFGYLTLNDDKHEVAESRNYGEEILNVGRSGNIIFAVHDGKVFTASVESPRYNFSDFTQVDSSDVIFDDAVPLSEGRFLALKKGYEGYIYMFTPSGNSYKAERIIDDPWLLNYQRFGNGVAVTGNVLIHLINDDGTIDWINRPEDVWRMPATFVDRRNLYTLTDRKGLRHYEMKNGSWSLVSDYAKPNSPATFISTSLAYHPSYGLLAGSSGIDYSLKVFNQNTPANISALRGNFWKEYSPTYTRPDKFGSMANYAGVAIDPKDTKYVYRSSALNGIERINLEDPSDILLMGQASNPYKNFSEFIQVVPDLAIWNALCRFSVPRFDSEGRMWMTYNYENQEEHLYYWTAADRKATTSPASYRPMKKIVAKGLTPQNFDVLTAMTYPANRNFIAIASDVNYGGVYLYDHNGTPEVTSDDRYVLINNPYDQDGGSVTFNGVNDVVEDPESGMLWILSQRGLFTVNPVNAFNNPTSVNRIKVARNDGTNLADYLLNEVNVYCMAIDGEKRKWFGTSNGLVCTTSDGRAILGEFTTENSYLPSGDVYALCYNPENNSLMAATGQGLVEVFPSGSGGNASTSSNDVRVYPNPVEPDFYGWVRIDNVADGSLVKITDATGGIVKELGPVEGGAVQWDVTGHNNKRVATGVYYIMVSPGSAGGNTSINKILVLN